jgi:hypothetical protein
LFKEKVTIAKLVIEKQNAPSIICIAFNLGEFMSEAVILD